MSIDPLLDLISNLPPERISPLDYIGRPMRNRVRAVRLLAAIKGYTGTSQGDQPLNLETIIKEHPEEIPKDALSYELENGGTAPWIYHSEINPNDDPDRIIIEAPESDSGRKLVGFANSTAAGRGE